VSSSEQSGIAVRPDEQQGQYAQQLLNVATVYNVYRILLPVVLLLTYVSTYATPALGMVNPNLFIQITSGYVVLGALLVALSSLKKTLALEQRYLTSVFVLDILILSFLAYLSGGVVSGLSLLLIVNIAFANMLLPGRFGVFIAAIATLSIIYSEAYLTLTFTDYPAQFMQSGILGAILFATSLYIQYASRRAMAAARLAEEQATSIVDLEKLNNEIIQRMRTGIMVVNSSDGVVTLNNAAQSLLAPVMDAAGDETGARGSLPEQLKQQIASWRANPLYQGEPIKVPGSNANLQTNFAYLNAEADSDILVFLENQSRIMQRIRQTKLASLGRLTANIAHEIRNPLGAISHAGQMLKESEHLSSDENRMLEIILNQSDRINQMIEEVLDVSRHKDVAPTVIDLQQWMEDFIKQYQDSNTTCDEIDFTYQGSPAKLRIITSQLERVFTNLFDNGLRYSSKATGRASLKVIAGVTQGVGDRQHPFVSVIDSGQALDEEAESRLFEPFHTTESGGTGLGLYISKELCEANQATLDYSASDAGTSCFTVNFSSPLPSQPEQPASNQQQK
jgi:two-component system sensor histidine kinase PilS (NtrC family)